MRSLETWTWQESDANTRCVCVITFCSCAFNWCVRKKDKMNIHLSTLKRTRTHSLTLAYTNKHTHTHTFVSISIFVGCVYLSRCTANRYNSHEIVVSHLCVRVFAVSNTRSKHPLGKNDLNCTLSMLCNHLILLIDYIRALNWKCAPSGQKNTDLFCCNAQAHLNWLLCVWVCKIYSSLSLALYLLTLCQPKKLYLLSHGSGAMSMYAIDYLTERISACK